jgi:hypothetical protein
MDGRIDEWLKGLLIAVQKQKLIFKGVYSLLDLGKGNFVSYEERK